MTHHSNQLIGCEGGNCKTCSGPFCVLRGPLNGIRILFSDLNILLEEPENILINAGFIFVCISILLLYLRPTTSQKFKASIYEGWKASSCVLFIILFLLLSTLLYAPFQSFMINTAEDFGLEGLLSHFALLGVCILILFLALTATIYRDKAGSYWDRMKSFRSDKRYHKEKFGHTHSSTVCSKSYDVTEQYPYNPYFPMQCDGRSPPKRSKPQTRGRASKRKTKKGTMKKSQPTQLGKTVANGTCKRSLSIISTYDNPHGLTDECYQLHDPIVPHIPPSLQRPSVKQYGRSSTSGGKICSLRNRSNSNSNLMGRPKFGADKCTSKNLTSFKHPVRADILAIPQDYQQRI